MRLGTKRVRKMELRGDAEAQKTLFERVPESMKVTVRIIYKNDLRRMGRQYR